LFFFFFRRFARCPGFWFPHPRLILEKPMASLVALVYWVATLEFFAVAIGGLFFSPLDRADFPPPLFILEFSLIFFLSPRCFFCFWFFLLTTFRRWGLFCSPVGFRRAVPFTDGRPPVFHVGFLFFWTRVSLFSCKRVCFFFRSGPHLGWNVRLASSA